MLRYVLLVGWRFSGLGGLDGVFGLPVSFDLVWGWCNTATWWVLGWFSGYCGRFGCFGCGCDGRF